MLCHPGVQPPSGTWTSRVDRQDRKAETLLVPRFADHRQTVSGTHHVCPTADVFSLQPSPSGWHLTTGPSAQNARGSPRQASVVALCSNDSHCCPSLDVASHPALRDKGSAFFCPRITF